ncbi:MAG: ComF family protein [Prolixibacteraceae bacterium]|nr:ComF family protein [Prolixibacteraceae bacterium]
MAAGLTELFYPSLCVACERKLFVGERFICLFCLQDLPRTNYHLDTGNKIAQLFWGRAEVEYATAWLYFRKGSRYRKLIHYLKYKGLKEIGESMGLLFGSEIRDSVFNEADILIPIPLHKKRLKARGYNQSEWIARGLSKALGKPLLTDNLMREKFTSTQTQKTRFERWKNVEGIFAAMRSEEITGRHILLVDDVVTTGATLEAAIHALLDAGAAKVSIAALAVADN